MRDDHVLRVFSNIPNPYNGHLYEALRSQGEPVTTRYKGDPSSLGRPWMLDLGPHESVSTGWLSDARAMLRAQRSTVVLTGGYIGVEEVLRRIIAPLVARGVWFWGERFMPRPVLGPYRSWYFRRFDGVFAVGSWAAPCYEAVVRPGTKVHVLPYTTTHRRPARDLAPAPLVGFAGSLIDRKGLDRVVHALSNVPRDKRPEIEVVGSGDQRDSLETLARGAAVEVKWLGEMSSVDLDEVRARWWAQVVPSRYDGWGVVVSEALAAGVPVIVSETVGAGVDLVRDGYNGTRVATNDRWAEAICGYRDEQRVEREGLRARVVGEEMSAEKAAPWLTQVLEAGPSGPARSFVAEAWGRALHRSPC